ncbi:MAG: hypothetical protein AB1439_08815 [candidate division FCPU426 bacterium]
MARIRFLGLGLLLATAGLAAGCNFLAGLHSDGRESNAHVLVADGKAALERGDYALAVKYFRQAGENNPRDSEARVGYAQARMGQQGFSLGEFANTFIKAVNSDSGSNQNYEFLVPSQWGVATYADVEDILSEMIAVLDPVVLGQTDGPYRSKDVNLNLTTGVLYLLRIVARLEQISADFSIQTLVQGTPELAALGLDPALLAQLPNEFLWLINSSGQQPPTFFLTAMQSDIAASLQRLQVAAVNSMARSLIEDVINQFDPWQILANQ